jgi:hypothetical protein
MKAMTVYDIVKKLIGPIEPLGESNGDIKRFENLIAMTELIGKLLFDVDQVSNEANSDEYSVARAGEFAKEFIEDVRNPRYI